MLRVDLSKATISEEIPADWIKTFSTGLKGCG